MTDDSRRRCEGTLRQRFNEYRNTITAANDVLVFEAVDAYVDCLRGDGETPESMIIAIKLLAKGAAAVRLDRNRRQEDLSLSESRLDDIVTRAIGRYFGAVAPAKGFRP